MTWRPDQPIVWEEKTTAPGVTADANNGYLVGDLWIDETADVAYICVDSTAGAAVWKTVFGSAAAILAALITVDGTGSGLDADVLDGSHATAFVTHALATAVSDFLAASGSGVFVKKTLAETKTLLGVDAATTSASGVVELATVAEAVAGTDTTRTVTSDGLAAGVAVVANPKAMSQGVNMTAATSGSNGIQVADSDQIDFGTGDFTLVWWGSLPDWTPSATQYMLRKRQDASNMLMFGVDTDGTLYIQLNATGFSSTVANALIAGAIHEIVASVSVGTTNTVLSYYIDGLLFGTAVTKANAGSVSNTASLYVLGTDTIRYAGTCQFAATYNRALTAAEVLALYRNGIDFADKWGSQTSLNSATLENVAGTAYPTFSGESATGFHAESNETATNVVATTDAIPFVNTKKYRMSFALADLTGDAPRYGAASNQAGASLTGAVYSNVAAAGINNYEFTAGETTTGVCLWYNTTATTYTVSLFSIVEIGATRSLEPEGIQPAPGQWLDSSSNKLHALMPAVGATLIRQKIDPCWMMWETGTVDQFIHLSTTGGAAPGTTRVIFPAGNYWIDEIYAWSAGTPTFQLGDSAAAPNTLVAAVLLVASTWTKLALLKNSTTTDDIFVDFTLGGAVTKFKIKYHLLETC